MSFPNLDSRPSFRMVSFFDNHKERLPIPEKRTTSLSAKVDHEHKTTNGTNAPVTLANDNNTQLAVKPNEYTKTSLDRTNSQERAKKRLILHQQQQQQIHHQQQNKQQQLQHQKNKQQPLQHQIKQQQKQQPNQQHNKRQSQEHTSAVQGALLEQLDPSDDVFVNYYKQVNSTCKAFSTFRGPLPDPKKYLQDDDNPQTLLFTALKEAVVEGSKDEEGSEGSEGKNVDYTPLSNETNYVKVSPPKLMRRQKKTGEDDSSGCASVARKTKKEKALSPNKNNKKAMQSSNDQAPLNHSPNLANDTDCSIPLHRDSSSNSVEKFPPPPPQLLEQSFEYISLDNAEMKVSPQLSGDKCFSTTKERLKKIDSPPKGTKVNETKATNKVGTVFPRQIHTVRGEGLSFQPSYTLAPIKDDQAANLASTNSAVRSVMEVKLTLRLEGNGENPKITIQEFKEDQCEKASEKPPFEMVDEKANTMSEVNSAIITRICQAVTTSARGHLASTLCNSTSKNTTTSQTNYLYDDNTVKDLQLKTTPKSFQNSVYGLTDDLPLSETDAFKTFPNLKDKSAAKALNGTLESPPKCAPVPSEKHTLADYGTKKLTTVAQMHRSVENSSHIYTPLDARSDKAPSNENTSQSYTCIQPPLSTSANNDLHGDDNDDDEFETLKFSALTHMNWDDLMQEAKSLGIPLNRPDKAIASNRMQSSATQTTSHTTTSSKSEFFKTTDKYSPTCVIFSPKTTTTLASPSNVASFTLSKPAFTLPKNTTPTLASHRAALQKDNTTIGNQSCSCPVPNEAIYDQPRNFKHVHSTNMACPCNQHSVACCRLKKQNHIKTEKRFYFFRIKLANLFCKRLCGKGTDHHPKHQVAYKAVSESYKCSCSSSHPSNLFSSFSAKQVSSKKWSTDPKKEDLDARSFDTALVSKKTLRHTKPVDTCHHNCQRPCMHHKSEHCVEEDSFDLQKNLERLKKHAWYWGSISSEEAEGVLVNRKDGSFLVRDSSDDRYILSLSFRSDGQTHHTRIEEHKGRFSFFSHWSDAKCSQIDRFILEAMELSKQGKNLYYLKSKHISSVPTPVRLLYPVLQH